jgi:cytochrome c-type biogenesis protein CcmH/NrfF
LIVALAVLLNSMGSMTVAKSPLHGRNQKILYIALIWLIPVFGVLLTVFLLNKDIKRKQKQLDDETIPAIKKLATQIDQLETSLHRRNNR